MKNFALVGAAGFVAPRHVRAIRDTGNNLVMALDPHDAVGYLDNYFPSAEFFTDAEMFERFAERIQEAHPEGDGRIHYTSICSPNYLHDAHVHMALRIGSNAICEKPLTIDPRNLEALKELEARTGNRVYTILQLRHHASLAQWKHSLESQSNRQQANIRLKYITRRGAWYNASWKGSKRKSGGLAMNIGIHFFDILVWIFGSPVTSKLHLNESNRMAGTLELDWAHVEWFLSIDIDDLPRDVLEAGGYAHRSITMDGEEIDFSDGFSNPYTIVYREILEGRGLGIDDARPSLELVHMIYESPMAPPNRSHPLLS